VALEGGERDKPWFHGLGRCVHSHLDWRLADGALHRVLLVACFFSPKPAPSHLLLPRADGAELGAIKAIAKRLGARRRLCVLNE